MKIKLPILLFCHLFLFKINSQELQLSKFAEISVLTIGPGKVLNDAFGHSAFRIKDPMFRLDIVYNYGVYDFEAPNFYLKFAQGKLDYLIGLDPYDKFFNHYTKRRDRTVIEQKLNLNQEQKQRLFNFLRNNYLPENRRYLYDFFYDNCATRIRDVVKSATNDLIEFKTPESLSEKTFRDLIYEHVDKNSWGSFGIDVALGSVIDQKAKPYEFMFLPKYIEQFFNEAQLASGKSLVRSTEILYEQKNTVSKSSFFRSPLFINICIGLLIILWTVKDFRSETRSKWLDAILFSLTGLIGIVVLLLWFATDHAATAWNFNFLWAFPFNLILVFPLLKKQPKKWMLKFIKFLLLLIVLMTLHWLIGVQVFAVALIPIVLALGARYIYLVNYLSTVKI